MESAPPRGTDVALRAVRTVVPGLLAALLLSACAPDATPSGAGTATPDGPAAATATGHDDLADAVPADDRARIGHRFDADLNGDGRDDVVLVLLEPGGAAMEADSRTLRLLRGTGTGFEAFDGMTLPPSPHGLPMLSMARGVLVVEDLTGGTRSTRATYRYRYDGEEDAMRLIGLDAERQVPNVLYDRLSWNLLTGERLYRHGLFGEQGGRQVATDGPEQVERLPPPSPVYMAQTPDPDEILDTLTGDSMEACDEDDIACREQAYEREEGLFMYETTIDRQIGAMAQPCWEQDKAAFRRRLGACPDAGCRLQALAARLAELHELQPQEWRVNLPPAPDQPLLIAVLGPEHEVVAATPADAPTREIEGALIHASTHVEHMGVAVASAAGDHVFIFDMELDGQPGHNQVMALVGTSPTAQVRVRGWLRQAPDGVDNFDTARCRWVHQLPR